MTEKNLPAMLDDTNPLTIVSAVTEVDEVFAKEVGSDINYLPYTILMGKSADLTGPPHYCTPGEFYLVEQSGPRHLGNKIDVHITAYRMKALKYREKQLVASHNTEDPLYLEIKEMSDKLAAAREQTDAEGFNYLWGPEYLIWLGDAGLFTTFFCSNKTLKRAAREVIHSRRGQLATFEHDWITTARYSWWGIKVYDCTTQLATQPSSTEYVQKVIDKFLSEKNIDSLSGGETVMEEEDTVER